MGEYVMKNLIEIINNTIITFLNEQHTSDIKSKMVCVEKIVKNEFLNYKIDTNKDYDDKWFDLRSIHRIIEHFLKTGYFRLTREEHEQLLNDFLQGLNYSNSNIYRKGDLAKETPTGLKIYYAEKKVGDDVLLFRGVGLNDFNRIKSQGYIDTDMRGAISQYEGTNLAQNPNTAEYYLPHNDYGVIMAINPSGLDLFIMADEYIRVFEPIPFENVVKVSEPILKDEHGSILSTTNMNKRYYEIIQNLKTLDVDIIC